MPGGKKNIKPEDNTNGFQKNPQNINRNGAPPSIRNQIKEILAADGSMKIKWEDVITIQNNDFVEIKLLNKEMSAIKLFQWAMSSNPAASIRALQTIIEQTDGKATQSLELHQTMVNIDRKQWVGP